MSDNRRNDGKGEPAAGLWNALARGDRLTRSQVCLAGLLVATGLFRTSRAARP